MSVFRLDADQVARLEAAMKDFLGDTETTINDVLHNEGGQLIHDEIKRLMPMSGKRWKGKKPPAKTRGENIIKWSQLKILHVVQHLVFIISLNGHKTRTQLWSHI